MDSCINTTLTISNQSDIDNGPLQSCGSGNSELQLEIVGATGTLNFTNITTLYSVSVAQSPDLEVLELPQLTSLNFLDIIDATGLNSLSAPNFNGANSESADGGFAMQIFNAPILYNNLNLQIPTHLNTVSLWDSGETTILVDKGKVIPSFLLANITQLSFFQTNGCYDLTDLEVVSEVHLTGTKSCDYGLANLKSVGSLDITEAANTIILGPTADQSPPSIQVDSSVTLSETVWMPDNRTGFYSVNEIEFSRIDSIGENLNISSNANLEFTFDGLTSVGATLTLSNNTNCTFNFNHVSQVTDLMLLDNINSTIPVFGSLQRAKNIYLRGFIDINSGSNLFPALTLVSGNVTIETLNPDFNCSKLVQQRNDGIIQNLACNGTNDGSDTTPTSNGTDTTSKASDGTGLSAGAYAGIGIGAGIVLLGAIFAITWLVLHHIRSLKKLKTTHKHSSDQPLAEDATGAPYIDSNHESDGTGIVREKPDDPLTELGIGESELPDDPLIELPTRDVGQPTQPQTLTSIRRNDRPLPGRLAEGEYTGNMHEEGVPHRKPDHLLGSFSAEYVELPAEESVPDNAVRSREESQRRRFKV
ncbi:hypothetical protein F5Y12DRAFT_232120 [Xylaria sp. FL1777]|nr:hypothetical protein F5Y12DRAFT_232120 [Xylaria sp. FL1777]